MCGQRLVRALVTGAAGGIGRSTCLALVEQARRRGAEIRIAAADRSLELVEPLVADLNAAGARATAHAGDLADAQACARLGDEAIRACGGLDVLASVAGITRTGPLAQLEVADWDHVMNADARATWLLARAVYTALAQSRGAIVAVASMAGLFPFPGLGAYSPAKAALLMLCRQLAQEWASVGIRVNTVSPGLIRTPLTESIYADPDVAARRAQMVPLQRIGKPEDVASAIAFLAGPDSSYLTGIDMRIDGGVADGMLGTIPGMPGQPASSMTGVS